MSDDKCCILCTLLSIAGDVSTAAICVLAARQPRHERPCGSVDVIWIVQKSVSCGMSHASGWKVKIQDNI